MGILSFLKKILKSECGKTFKLKSLLRNIAIFFLIYLPISSQYFVFVPWLSQYKHNLVWFILVPYNIIYVISLLNYFICTFIDPGKVSKKVTKEYLPTEYMTSIKGSKNEDFLKYKKNSSENIIEVENKIIKDIYEEKTWCAHCQSYKPPRAHHCSICKCCVLKFDHHCIWINNCVGHRNLPFFLRFLFYISLLFTISFILLFCVVRGYIMFQDRYHSELYFPVTNISRKMAVMMIINGFISFVLYCFILSMTLYQIIYFVCNMTRIERIQVSRIAKLVERGTLEVSQKYPYDLGLYRNLEQVFGKNYWLWWLCSTPLGDGADFPVNQPDSVAIHWPPPEFILYEKFPYRSKEFYSGIANGSIEPPPDILEGLSHNGNSTSDEYTKKFNPLTEQNIYRVNKSPNKNNIKKDIHSTSISNSSTTQPFTNEDSDDSDNDALMTILLRKKKEKQK